MGMEIKDSGNRREFETGAVRDMQEGKGRCDLMPLCIVAGILGSPTIDSVSLFCKYGDPAYLRNSLFDFAKLAFENPETMFLELAKHYESGAKKYGENNWQKGIPVNSFIDSAVRHYLKWCRGDKDEPHDVAFVWNIVSAIWTCENKPELNRYKETKCKKNITRNSALFRSIMKRLRKRVCA